ncbi:MAG TPA: crosslink repair DNA glycosylase YcaQ family protein [Thermoleophilaceae bacterium]
MAARIPIEQARRLALHAQGLAKTPDAGQTVAEVVQRIGCLQLDPVAAVARSPLLVLNARMRGGASEKAVNKAAYKDRVLFDYWAHEASLCHIDDLALHRWQMQRWLRLPRRRPYAEFLRRNAGFAEDLVDEIRERGPLRAQDIAEREIDHWKHGHWTDDVNWRQTIARLLDVLWLTGRIGVHSRDGLTRRWHVLEECLPPKALAGVEQLDDWHATCRAVDRALSMLGVAKAGHVRKHFTRNRYPRLEDALAANAVELRVNGTSGVWYAREEDLAKDLEPGRRTIALSPFDNLICDRARTAELFGFDHRLEIYVPPNKRIWGYYVLPILHGERFVARADLKLEDGRLRVLSLHEEPGRRAPAAVRRALDQLARWRRATVTQ